MSISFSLDDLRNVESTERVLRQFETAIQATSSSIHKDLAIIRSDLAVKAKQPTIVPASGINIIQTPDQITITNTGATSILAGTGISVSGTGDITVTNTGVLSAIGTTNQISVSAATGNITFSTPQNIHTSATVQFLREGLGLAADTNSALSISQSQTADYVIKIISAKYGIYLQGAGSAGSTDLFRFLANGGSTDVLSGWSDGSVKFANDTLIVNGSGLPTKSNNVTLSGQGFAIVVASGSATAQTTAVASICSYTTTSSGGSFEICGYIDVTAFTAGTISLVCDYTDPGGTARTVTIPLASLAGAFSTTVGSATDAQSAVLAIRTSGANAIKIYTTVSLLTATYSVYAWIKETV